MAQALFCFDLVDFGDFLVYTVGLWSVHTNAGSLFSYRRLCFSHRLRELLAAY